jgi:hypothetical protein
VKGFEPSTPTMAEFETAFGAAANFKQARGRHLNAIQT